MNDNLEITLAEMGYVPGVISDTELLFKQTPLRKFGFEIGQKVMLKPIENTATGRSIFGSLGSLVEAWNENAKHTGRHTIDLYFIVLVSPEGFIHSGPIIGDCVTLLKRKEVLSERE